MWMWSGTHTNDVLKSHGLQLHALPELSVNTTWGALKTGWVLTSRGVKWPVIAICSHTAYYMFPTSTKRQQLRPVRSYYLRAPTCLQDSNTKSCLPSNKVDFHAQL